MKNFTVSGALAIGAGAVIVALTGAAFWLSYAHLAEVALAHGLGQATERAWAWPATLDLFIVAGELLMLRAALRQQVDGWAIALTAVGSIGSIALNVAGVTGTRAVAEVPILDYVVAAVPPTAALLAFGALMRQIHQALAKREVPAAPDTRPEPVEEPNAVIEDVPAVPEVVPAGVRLLPLTTRPEPVKVTTSRPAEEPPHEPKLYRLDEAAVVTPGLPDLPFQPIVWPVPKPTAVPAEQPRQVVTESVALTPRELLRRARTLNRRVVRETGRQVTIEQLRDEYNLSRREAAALRRDVVTELAASARKEG